MSTDKEEKTPKILAKDRTDLAFHRTILANERTYSAWLRTGLASLVAGIGVPRLLSNTKFPMLIKIIGTIFLLASAGIFIIAFWRFRKENLRLESEYQRHILIWPMSLLTIALFTTALLTFIILNN